MVKIKRNEEVNCFDMFARNRQICYLYIFAQFFLLPLTDNE